MDRTQTQASSGKALSKRRPAPLKQIGLELGRPSVVGETSCLQQRSVGKARPNLFDRKGVGSER